MTIWLRKKAYGSVFKSTEVHQSAFESHKSSRLSVRFTFCLENEMRMLFKKMFLILARDLSFAVR